MAGLQSICASVTNPTTGQVTTSLGERMRFCPSCWKDRVETGGRWVVKRGVRRFKCAGCMAKERAHKRAA